MEAKFMRLPRLRFTVMSMMIAVASFALLANRLRSISQGEAVEVATRRFRQIQGASAWDEVKVHSSYVSDGGDGKSYWIVEFRDPADDKGVAQVWMDPKGKILATLVVLPGSAFPQPAEALTSPIPPPKQ
jgi:hypothetical protein